MKLLLDTHTFLWWVEGTPRLSSTARQRIENGVNECYLSLASCWEMAIKSGVGKLELAIPVMEYVPQHLSANGFRLLEISFRHVARIEQLERHHQDPFDRLIVAQAMEEKMAIVSTDTAFDLYGVKRVW